MVLSDHNYIVMDLEFNYPNTTFRSEHNGFILYQEIIEIGAVKLDKDLNQIDTFCKFIKPAAYPKVNKQVQELTDITTEMIWEGDSFKSVYNEFINWCGPNAEFITWSDNDIIALEDNLGYHELPLDNIPKCYDIQMMFDDQVTMENRNYALSYAMWKMDIKPALSHDALNDAINTAEVMRRLDLSSGLDEYEI